MNINECFPCETEPIKKKQSTLAQTLTNTFKGSKLVKRKTKVGNSWVKKKKAELFFTSEEKLLDMWKMRITICH